QVGDLDFGPEATLDVLPLQVRWFDHWLKGIDTGLLDEPPVRIFVMGANRWRNEQDWPLPGTRYVPYYLHSAVSANSLGGDGLLSPEPPGDDAQDTSVSDPTAPAPTVGGRLPGSAGAAGPFAHPTVEARPDFLSYTIARANF